MPICLLETNLPATKIPKGFHNEFTEYIADVLTKDKQKISVTVQAGLSMSRGGSEEMTLILKIWSIGVFSPEKNPVYSSSIFKLLKILFPDIPEERVVLMFLPIEAHDVRVNI